MIVALEQLQAANPKRQIRLGYRASHSPRATGQATAAFTLLEVTVAIGLFFMATFSILALVSQNLKAVHSLNHEGPTPIMVAAQENLFLTNKLEEGSQSGDFGELYPDYSWTYDIRIHGTNGLFQADIVVLKKNDVYGKHSMLIYAPDSAQGVSRR